MTNVRPILLALGTAAVCALPVSLATGNRAAASTAGDLNADSNQALRILYRTQPFAQTIARQAKAILIFPHIVKAGLVFGGAYGEGQLTQGRAIEATTIHSRHPGALRPVRSRRAMSCS